MHDDDPALYTLTVADRCDKCGAQAYWRFSFPRTMHQLLFCAHHGAQYEQKLLLKGAIATDERARLFGEVKT